MKKIVVAVECTDSQKERIIKAAGENEVIFSKDITGANAVIGEPDISVIKENSSLEWIQMTWAGTDKYTMNEGFPKNVRLTNASGAFGVIISEYIIGAILNQYRLFSSYYEQQKSGIWKDAGKEESLYKKRVLFIGTGDICANAATRLKAFGTYNIGLNRHGNGSICGFDELDVISNIDKYIQTADLVISAVPNKPETRHLLNRDRLFSMKKDATLVNVGRGTLLEVDELNEVLAAGHLKSVILDVTNPEPLPEKHPLWKQERCMITPHISGKSQGHCEDTQERIIDICCENIRHYLNSEALIHEITDTDFEYTRI